MLFKYLSFAQVQYLSHLEWRRSVSDTICIDVDIRSNAPLLYGGNPGAIQQAGSNQFMEHLPNIQRYCTWITIISHINSNSSAWFCPINSKSIMYKKFKIHECKKLNLGVGYCAVFIAFYVSFYYNVIIGWSLYYAANSLALTLPWTTCNNTWNTEYCVSKCENTTEMKFPCNETRSPAKEYFK